MNWLRWLRWTRAETPHVAAVQRAQDRLDDVKSKDDEVNMLARQLREIRDRNNFAAMLAASFRERRP